MNNDNIELLKFIELHHYDVDKTKTKIYVDPTTSEITCNLFLNRRTTTCKYCRSTHTVVKETKIKEINHCIKPQTKITIFFHQKKFKCKECNHTFMENNPIGESISYYGEIAMIEMLRNPRKTFSDVAGDCFTSTQNVINHFDKRVNINRHPLTKVLCFDELYGRKLTKTKYSFTIYDPMSNTILDILDARRKNVLEDYFSHIPIRELNSVQYVNIDMWSTYAEIAEYYLPNATICVDSFHVIKHLNDAMTQIRLNIQRRFAESKDNDRNGYYWLLKTFSYYFVEDFDNIKYTRRPKSHYGYLVDKHAVLAKLLSINDDLKNAYYLKEEYREFNLTEEYSQYTIDKIEDFIEKFKKSKFIEFRNFASTLDRWKYYIANSFIRVNGKRMSNGPMESLNGRTGRILEDGYGYTDFERFRNRAMFALNKNEPIKML